MFELLQHYRELDLPSADQGDLCVRSGGSWKAVYIDRAFYSFPEGALVPVLQSSIRADRVHRGVFSLSDAVDSKHSATIDDLRT